MNPTPLILIVDSHVADAALARAVLERELPAAEVITIDDALAFAEAVSSGRAALAIVASDLPWAKLDKLLAVLARRMPATATIVFGRDDELLAAAQAGFACDGLLAKSSAGFVALAGLASTVLARRQAAVAVPADSAAPTANAPVAAVASPTPAASSERNQAEMRDIALVFSHDLKEPVQQIMRLARRAQSGEDGAPRTATSLQQIVDCATRANSMLDATLEYLSVAGRAMTPTVVDLNVCLEHALENLRVAIDDAGAEIVADHLPLVVGDQYQVLHLIQNLLSNALKFRSREPPKVRISVTQQDDAWLLAFRDNGIGIAPAHAERIFEMGQRLHTRDEYPGSGIGLTLCKRIVERLGGRIWVESADGAGATFYILLPRAPSQLTRPA